MPTVATSWCSYRSYTLRWQGVEASHEAARVEPDIRQYVLLPCVAGVWAASWACASHTHHCMVAISLTAHGFKLRWPQAVHASLRGRVVGTVLPVRHQSATRAVHSTTQGWIAWWVTAPCVVLEVYVHTCRQVCQLPKDCYRPQCTSAVSGTCL